MSYRNKTYVIFDGDNDMWAYAYMKGWISRDHIDFNFYDAHDLKPLTQSASDETVYARLRERMANTKQAIVLIGDQTKTLRKFVPWELGLILKKQIPLIAVNLNGKRQRDPNLCPAIIRDEYVAHVSFRAKIVQYALDHFLGEYAKRPSGAKGARFYNDSVYQRLGVND
jgi:hypothetical protein